MVRNLNVAAARTGAALPQDLRLRRLVFGAPGIAQLLLADSRSDSFRVWRWICWTVQRSTQVPVVRRRFVTVWLIRWVVHLRPLQGMIRPDVSPRCQRRPPLVRRKLSPYRPAIHISDFSTATARRFRQCGAHRHIAGERKKGVAVVQQLRRWFVDQGGEPVESGDRLAAARDDDVEMSVDEMPSDAGMSNVEYAVGTVVAAA